MKTLRQRGLAECRKCGVTLFRKSGVASLLGYLLPVGAVCSMNAGLLVHMLALIPATALGFWLHVRYTRYELPPGQAPVPQLPGAKVILDKEDQ